MTNLIDREGMRRDVLAMEKRALDKSYMWAYAHGYFGPERRAWQFAKDCRAFAAELEGRIHEN